jgi:uncharacterized protein involved in type VI secretion and phage assembly
MKRVHGVVTALVREIDGRGRLKLEYRWLTDESHRSTWAPVAAALAGSKRGAFLMPEVNDEVLVAFEHGDFDHPFVVGFLWNGVDAPPETSHSNRVLKTPGGHELRFEDGDPKKIRLRSNGGQRIEIDDQQNSITIEGGGRRVTLANGFVDIQ